MSLSLYGVPDGQQKGQSAWPCPSVYSPTTTLGSLSSVALSSAPAPVTLAQGSKQDADYDHFRASIWSGFLAEATNAISSGFLHEAIGVSNCLLFRIASVSNCSCVNCEVGNIVSVWQQVSFPQADGPLARTRGQIFFTLGGSYCWP